MKLKIEHSITGPLSNKPILHKLEKAVENSNSLDEASANIIGLGLGVYRGGSHVAVHPIWNGLFQDGSQRLAIVTD
jgi:hypothetical protein